MIECNGKSNLHDPLTIHDGEVERVICKQCKHQDIIRKDPVSGAPEKRQYAKIFRRLILQPKDPLFYKIYPQYLKI